MSEDIMLGQKIWAVVGATPKTDQYGYRLYNHLKSKGYQVYAVNPACDAIDGQKCYPDLTSLPEKPQVLSMVVSPKNGKPVIEEAAALGIKYAWFQPGSHDDELLALAKKLGIEYVQACLLISAP